VSSVTGLHRASLGWACFTDWDLGSYVYSIIFARKLGLISDSGPWQFDDRISKVLTFLENRPLSSDPSSGYPIPFWSYRFDVLNPFQACSTKFTDAADSGRLLAALYALNVTNSAYSSRVNAIHARTKQIYDSMATKLGKDYYGYLAAEGFAAFGANESAVFSAIDNYPDSGSFVSVYGQSLPSMRTLSEPFIHAILEGGTLYHVPSAKLLGFATRVYLAQYGRFNATDNLTAWSEGSSAYGYIYEWVIYTNPPNQSQTWKLVDANGSILDPNDGTYSLIPLAYTKVAFAYLAIYGENNYTLALVNATKNLANPVQGFSEETLEDGTIPNYPRIYNDKTNELVLAAASRALSSYQTTVTTVMTTTPDSESPVIVAALVLSASLGAALLASVRKHMRSPGRQ
jgi:hypothetical protein